MNFLAHVYLSGDDPKVRVGNFIGDFVKGRHLDKQYERGIVRGIELHREIDFFTDHHAVVQQSKNRLRPKYRHYSGVIVDVLHDHFIARYWQEYSREPLDEFAKNVYALIKDHHHIVPEKVSGMLTYMERGNWLVNYAHIDGIHQALSGMSRRTPFKSKMEEASEDLTTHYKEFENEFRLFFPELKKHAEEWLDQK